MSGTGERIRILVVEDHTIVREGLRALLESHGAVQVVGEASEGAEAVRKACELEPDIVIMDLFLEGLNGLEAIERIKRKLPRTKVLVLSMYGNEEYVAASVRAGASGYLVKGSGISEVVRAISRLREGKTFFSPGLAEAAEGRGPAAPAALHPREKLDRLTPREREVLQLIAEGRTSSRIAEKLGISLKTAETHRTNLMAKLEIHNTAGLVRFAVSAGLVPHSSG